MPTVFDDQDSLQDFNDLSEDALEDWEPDELEDEDLDE